MPSEQGAHPPAGAQKVILVLEDEPDVRKLVADMLASNGYKVLTAANGESAINTFKRAKQPVDLVLLDVVSPGLSGPMVAERLAELQPGLRVLYMSGYDGSKVVKRYVVDKGHALLTKPFSERELAMKVREVLRTEPAG